MQWHGIGLGDLKVVRAAKQYNRCVMEQGRGLVKLGKCVTKQLG